MTSSLIGINHKSVSLTVTEIWLIQIFQGKFDLDLLFQGHPDSNQFFLITCSLHLKDFQCDTIYRFDGIASPKSLYIAQPSIHPSIHYMTIQGVQALLTQRIIARMER